MAHLIDKDALVAEIQKIFPSLPFPNTSETLHGAEVYGKRAMGFKILDLIDTLEVKEVDLDKTLTGFISRYAYENGGEYPSAIDIAKHFFELGLKARQG